MLRCSAGAAAQLAFNLSWVVNILAFAVKLWAYLTSHSKAVLVRVFECKLTSLACRCKAPGLPIASFADKFNAIASHICSLANRLSCGSATHLGSRRLRLGRC